MQALYEQATASVQINRNLAGPIAIRSGIRQGCPLSMVLYAFCIHPLLRSLEDSLPGVKLGGRHRSTPVITYVKVFVSNLAAFSTISEAVQRYERATRALLNTQKSKTLSVGVWEESITPLGIQFHDRVEILGITIGHTTDLSRDESWIRVIGAVLAQAPKSYSRSLGLAQRIYYVQL